MLGLHSIHMNNDNKFGCTKMDHKRGLASSFCWFSISKAYYTSYSFGGIISSCPNPKNYCPRSSQARLYFGFF